jgi:hypothetical protein
MEDHFVLSGSVYLIPRRHGLELIGKLRKHLDDLAMDSPEAKEVLGAQPLAEIASPRLSMTISRKLVKFQQRYAKRRGDLSNLFFANGLGLCGVPQLSAPSKQPILEALILTECRSLSAEKSYSKPRTGLYRDALIVEAKSCRISDYCGPLSSA